MGRIALVNPRLKWSGMVFLNMVFLNIEDWRRPPIWAASWSHHISHHRKSGKNYTGGRPFEEKTVICISWSIRYHHSADPTWPSGYDKSQCKMSSKNAHTASKTAARRCFKAIFGVVWRWTGTDFGINCYWRWNMSLSQNRSPCNSIKRTHHSQRNSRCHN